MATTPGTRLINVDNSQIPFCDDSVRAGTTERRFSNLADARRCAESLAGSSQTDAAIIAAGDDYVVVRATELSGLSLPSDGRLYDGQRNLVGVVAGNERGGVSLVRSSDRSTGYDIARGLLSDAGLSDAEIAEVFSGRVGQTRAIELMNRILATSGSMRSYAQRATAVCILAGAANGAHIDCDSITHEVRVYGRLSLVRPDGYLANAVTGHPQQKVGQVTLGDDGAPRAGRFRVGQMLAERSGVFWEIGPDLELTGGPVYELGLGGGIPILDPALDGVESALAGVVRSVVQLVRDPAGTIEGIGRLPSVIATLIRNSPELADRFTAMPFDDQVELVSNIATNIGMFALSGAGTARAASAAGQSARIPYIAGVSSSGALRLAVADAGQLAEASVVVVGATGTLAIAGEMAGDGIALMAESNGGPIGSRNSDGITRGEHAQIRNREGRPVPEATGDVQRARQADVYVQDDGRFVIRGANGREHIIEPNGELVTSLRRSRRAHLARTDRRPATAEEFQALKDLVR